MQGLPNISVPTSQMTGIKDLYFETKDNISSKQNPTDKEEKKLKEFKRKYELSLNYEASPEASTIRNLQFLGEVLLHI